MNIGIVGHEAAKFTPDTEKAAKTIISHIVRDAIVASATSGNVHDPVIVSGGCHLGGVDIWAEEYADHHGLTKIIHKPKTLSWSTGFMPRNIKIAEDSDIVHVIVVKSLPEGFRGMRFDECYHCHTKTHVKSGGCWTAKKAQRLGKYAVWHEVGGP